MKCGHLFCTGNECCQDSRECPQLPRSKVDEYPDQRVCWFVFFIHRKFVAPEF